MTNNALDSNTQRYTQSRLMTYLRAHYTKPGQEFNFTNVAEPKGKFTISEDEMDSFFDIYIRCVQKGIVPCLTQKPGPAAPLLSDIDFKFSANFATRQYTIDTVLKIVSEYFNVLKMYVELTDDNNKCYVLERDEPYVETKKNGTTIIKDGIHLIFPLIKCFAPLKHLAREHVIRTCGHTFRELGITNDPDDVVDAAVIDRNNWFCFGAGKPDRQPYKVKYIYSDDLDEVPFNESWDFVKLFDVAGIQENVVYIKEPILDIPETSARHVTSPTGAQPRSLDEESIANCVEKVAFDMLDKVVMNLATFRAKKYDDWTDVVWGINNISIENKYMVQGKELVHRFSAKDSEYDQDKVEKYLKDLKYRADGKKFGTLVMYLKVDNPAVHQQLFALQVKQSYSQLKEDFEKTHFKVITPPGFVLHNEDGFQPRSKKDLYLNDENLYYFETDSKGREVDLPFLKRWIADRNIRTYRKLDFLPFPNLCSDTTYNLFHGLRAEGLTCDFTEVDLGLIFDMHSKLCGNDPAFIEYSMSWWADLLQNPGRLSRVGMLWESPEGCGKNMWLNWFGHKILGEDYFFSSTNIDDMYGTFAPGLKHKLLVNVNELDSAGAHKYVERIKSSITDESITFQAKHVMTVSLKNYARFVLSTNNRNVIKAGVSDRRFAAVECDSSRRNDSTYFEPISQLMDDDRTARAFYNFLKNRDISSWKPSKRPLTKLYKDMRALSVPLLSLWLISLISADEPVQHVLAKPLYERCKEWLGADYGERAKKINPTTFGLDIKKYGGVTWDRTRDGLEYCIDLEQLRAWLIEHQHVIDDVDFIE